MIIEFSVQNHRSFREEQTLSLAASNYDKSLPENLVAPDLSGLPDLRIVKAAALYGPNAGGKTNFLVALQFLKWLVLESATGQRPDSKLPVEPFRLDHESAEKPTVFELIFIAEAIRYELAIAVTKERVMQERLIAFPNGRSQLWYDRVWNTESQQYNWLPENPTEFELDAGIIEKTRANALFLSTAAQWANKKIQPVYAWFAQKLNFLNLGADATAAALTPEHTARLVNSSGEARRRVADILRSADLGLTDVEAIEESLDANADKFIGAMKSLMRDVGGSSNMFPERFWQITFHHEGKKGERFTMNALSESAGTRRFFSVLGPWLALIEQGYVLCVDEIETSLHPTMAAELLRLLFKSTNNQSRSQLLFTTHNPLLLDMTLLRRDQVWFADKNQEGESFLYPLTDYKPRADESLVRGYLSGRYGAVPFIPHGLVAVSASGANVVEAKHAS